MTNPLRARRLAVIGAGISGLVAARRLCAAHEVTVYEAEPRAGGHTHTITVRAGGGPGVSGGARGLDRPGDGGPAEESGDEARGLAVDTGFIVFNERNYPRFTALLKELGVATQPSTMSFGLQCARSGLEYRGSTLNSLFAQRRNLLSPGFYRMIRDILRFNAEATALLRSEAGPPDLTLSEYLRASDYGTRFRDDYLLPMAAAIWSADPRRIGEFPLPSFLHFFDNHGLLRLKDRPQWRVVEGGSASYLAPLMRPFAERVRLATPVAGLRRDGAGGVLLRTAAGDTKRYHHVFLACHSDQALALIEDAAPLEREVLGAIAYQPNEAVLHTDRRLLPRRRLAWSAWNYYRPAHRPSEPGARVAVTYNMNILQGIPGETQYLVTLNRTAEVDPRRVIARIAYEHPVYDAAALAAQSRWREIDGRWGLSYCGAYWGYGFHEDGVASAERAAEAFERRIAEHEDRDAKLSV